MAHYARTTPLCYMGNFQPQELGPPLDKILDPRLCSVICRHPLSAIFRAATTKIQKGPLLLMHTRLIYSPHINLGIQFLYVSHYHSK